MKEEFIKRIGRINAEVQHGIAIHAVWWQGQTPDVAMDLSEEHGFSIVQNSLLFELLMSLSRLYDGRDSKNDNVSLVVVAEDLLTAHPKCPHAMGAREKIDEVVQGGALKVIRKLRHKVFAHNDAKGVPVRLNWGDETGLLRTTQDIATLLTQSVSGNDPGFGELGLVWSALADSYWSRMAPAQVGYF